MSEPVKKVQIALRAEMTLFRISLRRTLRAVLLLSLGGVFGLFAIGLLNYAAFEALRDFLSPATAGAVLAVGNLLVMGLLSFVALADTASSEEEQLANQIRDLAYGSLEEDLTAARKELRAFAGDVRRIRSVVAGVLGALSGPLGFLARFAFGGATDSDQSPEPEEAAD